EVIGVRSRIVGTSIDIATPKGVRARISRFRFGNERCAIVYGRFAAGVVADGAIGGGGRAPRGAGTAIGRIEEANCRRAGRAFVRERVVGGVWDDRRNQGVFAFDGSDARG